MKRTSLLVAVGVTVLLALVVGAALATPPKDATTTLITRATLGKFEAHNDGIKVESERHSADLAIAKVVIEPGGSTGWHHHPGVGPAAVKSGAVTFYDEDCEKTVYKAGEASLRVTTPRCLCATVATARRCSTSRSSYRRVRLTKGFGSTTHSQRSVTSGNYRGVWEGASHTGLRPSFFCPYSPYCLEGGFSEVRAGLRKGP